MGATDTLVSHWLPQLMPQQLLPQLLLPQQLLPHMLLLLQSLPQLSQANSKLKMSSRTPLTATPTSTLPSTRLAMPTVSSRPPTTLLMDLDSVLLPATCQLPQPPQR